MSSKSENDISEKLDVLIRLIAVGLTSEKTQKEQIKLLSSAGIQPKVIAEIIDTTPNNVSVTLSGLRKSRGMIKRK